VWRTSLVWHPRLEGWPVSPPGAVGPTVQAAVVTWPAPAFPGPRRVGPESLTTWLAEPLSSVPGAQPGGARTAWQTILDGASRSQRNGAETSSRNHWMPSGRHVERDESTAETALREAREETGLEAHLLPGPAVTVPAGFPHATVCAPWWVVDMRAASRQRYTRAACPPRPSPSRSRGGRRSGRGNCARDTNALGSRDRPGWRPSLRTRGCRLGTCSRAWCGWRRRSPGRGFPGGRLLYRAGGAARGWRLARDSQRPGRTVMAGASSGPVLRVWL
jgi:NUDIX domain